MSKERSHIKPFAYILIVESDKELRESALHTIKAPNCAIDVARDEDEAVHKALQHRPQLIIVKLHEALDIDPHNPPATSRASMICRRARLSRAVRLVTHSDVAFTIRSKVIWHPMNLLPLSSQSEVGQTFSHPEQVILIRPKFPDQAWRKEWYTYSGSERGMDFLSDHLPYWLGWTSDPPFPQSPESLLRRWKWGWIFAQTIFHKRMSEIFLN
jgi:hypothetical protein